MSEAIHPLPKEFAAKARIDASAYERDYAESVRDPDAFWRRIAQRLQWSKPFTQVKDTSYRLEGQGTLAETFFRSVYEFIASEWQDRSQNPDELRLISDSGL